MMDSSRLLIVGIGSPHGDDQAGWLLIDRLMMQVASDLTLRKATVPHNVMDWADESDILHIIDACDREGPVKRIELTNDHSALTTIDDLTRCQSSHHFGVGKMIELGRLLGKLPPKIVVWAIPGKNFGPGQPVSERCRQQVDRCAELLSTELAHA